MKKIWLQGGIGWEIQSEYFNYKLRDSDEDLTIKLYSPGGNVYKALEIYNIIKDYPGRVTVLCGAVVASATTIIAIAADELIPRDTTSFMIHEPWSGMFGKASELEDEALILRKLVAIMANIYSRKTKKTVSEIKKTMYKENWLSGQEIVDYGFVDHIVKSEEPLLDKVDINKEFAELKRQMEQKKPNPLADSARLLRCAMSTVSQNARLANLPKKGKKEKKKMNNVFYKLFTEEKNGCNCKCYVRFIGKKKLEQYREKGVPDLQRVDHAGRLSKTKPIFETAPPGQYRWFTRDSGLAIPADIDPGKFNRNTWLKEQQEAYRAFVERHYMQEKTGKSSITVGAIEEPEVTYLAQQGRKPLGQIIEASNERLAVNPKNIRHQKAGNALTKKEWLELPRMLQSSKTEVYYQVNRCNLLYFYPKKGSKGIKVVIRLNRNYKSMIVNDIATAFKVETKDIIGGVKGGLLKKIR